MSGNEWLTHSRFPFWILSRSSDFSPKLQDKIWNREPEFEARYVLAPTDWHNHMVGILLCDVSTVSHQRNCCGIRYLVMFHYSLFWCLHRWLTALKLWVMWAILGCRLDLTKYAELMELNICHAPFFMLHLVQKCAGRGNDLALAIYPAQELTL